MHTKRVKDLKVGDWVKLHQPEGTGRVTLLERSKLFTGAGGCFRIDADITSGPNTGKTVFDQHLPGDAEIEVFPIQ